MVWTNEGGCSCTRACSFPRALEGTSWTGDAVPEPGCSADDPPVALTLLPKPDLPGEHVHCDCKVLAPGAVTVRSPISLVPPTWSKTTLLSETCSSPCLVPDSHRAPRGPPRHLPAEEQAVPGRRHLTRSGSAHRSAPAHFGRCQTRASASSSAYSPRSAWERAELCSHTATGRDA